MNLKNPKSKIKFIFLALAWFSLVGSARAARIFPELKSFAENEKKFFEVSVFLDTEGDDVNILTGEMNFSATQWNLEKTQNGGSIANLWPQKPVKSAEGKIAFSGAVSNGYLGGKGFIFSAIFSSNNRSPARQAEVAFQNVEIYINDENGTKKVLPDTNSTLNLEMAEAAAIPTDLEPPEIFSPYVASDSNLEQGKWVVIVNAQDKGSGIDHYEIFESAKRYNKEKIAGDKSIKWKNVQEKGTGVLEDQNLESYIYVKAVDKAGNARVAEVVPAHDKKIPGFGNKAILAIITIFIISSTVFLRFRARKTKP